MDTISGKFQSVQESRQAYAAVNGYERCLVQNERLRFLTGALRLGFSRCGTGSCWICGVSKLSGCRRSMSVSIRFLLRAVTNAFTPKLLGMW
jgi:hypothetical protein